MEKSKEMQEIIGGLQLRGYKVIETSNCIIVKSDYGAVSVSSIQNEKGERWKVNNGHLLRCKEGVYKQVEETLNKFIKAKKSKILKAIEEAFCTYGQATFNKKTDYWTVHISPGNDKIKFDFNGDEIKNVRLSVENVDDIYAYVEKIKIFKYIFKKELQCI